MKRLALFTLGILSALLLTGRLLRFILEPDYIASSTYAADKAYFWIRRRGAPGNLVVRFNVGKTP
jgi:hypothetical protein